MNLLHFAYRALRSGRLGRVGERLLHRQVWRIQAGEGVGLKFKISHNPEYIDGTNEAPIQAALAAHALPGGVFYDIGASIGFFSVLVARRVGAMGTVYAFEPVAANAALVLENARLNHFDHLQTFEVAVGDKSGSMELFLSGWQGGASLIKDVMRPEDLAGSCRVDIVTLDRFIRDKGLRPPTLIKIDVEGAERQALEGMQETLAAFKPVLLYEVDDGSADGLERRWGELDGYVADLGYKVERIKGAYPNRGWFVGHSLAKPVA